MEHSPQEPVATDIRYKTSGVVGGEEVTAEEYIHEYQHHFENVSQYVQQNPRSTNTQLFSLLALLSAYLPQSYLLMSECQQILGPPDVIHGGPPFEIRMEPFTVFINTSNPSPGHVCMIHQILAQIAVELLAVLGISRSATVKLMFSLCRYQVQPYVNQLIKDLLIKREMEESSKEKFSKLIRDIKKQENFFKAVAVLETASDKFRLNPIFPQTLSRLYYNQRDLPYYGKDEKWAKEAIRRAPENSCVADTLGQIYKNRLLRATKSQSYILNMAEKAFRAFEEVERKAEKEEGQEMKDTAGTLSISNTFNNRGYFGFIQVAKIALEKLSAPAIDSFIKNKRMEVEKKFVFFEWYLTYSKPSMTTLEPYYFWRDVALCYKYYTAKTAAESTSFSGLFKCLNYGLFKGNSNGRHVRFEENEKTVSDLEEIQDVLKTTYEDDVDDVGVAERYILSNIILSNKIPYSPHLTPVKELQTILQRFLGTSERFRTPEFYLLVLLLFWPDEQPQVVQEEDDEEVEKKTSEDHESEGKTWEDEDCNNEQETRGEPAQLPLNNMFDPDLQQYVTFMEKAFKRGEHAKYLRGRYLLPLFFLGKGTGLSKWIHKSRLDAIVEKKVNADIADEQGKRSKSKISRINEMWISREVWQLPEIQHILLPVRLEPCLPSMMSQEQEDQEVFVCAGRKKIKASSKVELNSSVLSHTLFYLGFTIQGPVLFKGEVSHMS